MVPESHTTRIILALALCMVYASASAVTYRWKDKQGEVHYGEAVPAEYADQPYDVLNDAGMVIEHVEDTTVPMEVREENKTKKREPLISLKERERQYDRLLVIQYGSEDEIIHAMETELAQLGYDRTIIEQSRVSTINSIREQIRQAADQQRANMALTEQQQKNIEQLYAHLDDAAEKSAALDRRADKIRERFTKDLERYRRLTDGDEAQADQG